MYKVIRKANLMLARMDECQDMTALDRRNYTGYIHFLRGYAYYHILMTCGPAILVGDEIFESNLEGPAYNTYRATYDETVEYICSELETAAAYLPLKASIAQFERPTKGAAYALIARLRLHAASPLFNGTSTARLYFGNWKRTYDKEYYVNQNYSEEKWALAAAACKRVIDMNVYELFTVSKDQNTPQLPAGVPTGLLDAGLTRKVAAIHRGIVRNQPDPADPLDVMAKLGGFDIAGLCGIFLGGALEGVPVLADGFISGVAALCAVRLCPAAEKAVFASHCSTEPAAKLVLDALNKKALITAGLHLGEGTGAVAAIPLWDMALAVYDGCYSFAEGGIDAYTPQGGAGC